LKLGEMSRADPIPSLSQHLTFPLLLVTLLVSFGSSMLYGYNLAVVNAPAPIKAFCNATWSRRHGHGLAPSPLTLLCSLTVSVFALGRLLGSVLVGVLVARYGSALLVLLAGISMGFSQDLGSPEMAIFGCSIMGVHSGICLSVVPLYLGEIAPKSLRGLLGLVPSIFMCLGVFLAQVLGLPELLGEIWFYTNTIFEAAGIPAPQIPYVTVGTGAIEIVAGLIRVSDGQTDRCSPSGAQSLAPAPTTAAPALPGMRYVAVACVVGIIAGFCAGPAGVPFLMTAELFTQSHRPAAYVVPAPRAGAFCYLFFCSVCLLEALYVYLVVPETKNKTFVEISRIFTTCRSVLSTPAHLIRMMKLGGYGDLENSSPEGLGRQLP
uniref:Major facilitator superfamily (MFS) profile domain-containing protein n=1 Tax=Apteryx owenii TaxID=8824 RepID=A0A8B9P6K1_APTOW